jgi:hypothetical protein
VSPTDDPGEAGPVRRTRRRLLIGGVAGCAVAVLTLVIALAGAPQAGRRDNSGSATAAPTRAPAVAGPASPSVRASSPPTDSAMVRSSATRPRPGWQPTVPIRAAFYYPWFPEAWRQAGMDPFTRYHPALGQYNGSSSSVLQAHLRAMRYAGMQAGIASWWGQGSRTDRRVRQLLDAAAGQQFRWSVYHEGEGQGDPTVGQLTADLTYLRDHYGSDPGFLRIDGRFVVFVYAQDHDGCAMADRWKRANTVRAYIVLKVFAGYRTCAAQPDGWHQYGPAKDASDQAPYSYSVSPGFWKATEGAPRLARDVEGWRRAVRAMAASRARFQLVTTFNEWGEGTSVEAAAEWASPSGMGRYLDVLHETLGGAVS